MIGVKVIGVKHARTPISSVPPRKVSKQKKLGAAWRGAEGYHLAPSLIFLQHK